MAHGQMGYVEIPVSDVAKAADFYGPLCGWQFDSSGQGEQTPSYWTFAGPGDPAMGALERKDDLPAHTGGPLVYISVDDLDLAVTRVAELGGTVERDRTEIGDDMGFYALFRDPDGNRFGLWSTA